MQRFNVYDLAAVSCRRLLALLACLGAVSGQALAAGAQPPAYEAPHTRIRLFTAGPAGEGADATAMVGIEIIMEPGWKTYWRTPGEGIAPSFSWDESINLKEARVLWPAPVRFADADGSSIGYKERLVLPVAVTAQESTKPVSLSLAVAYGVCKDICMPVEAELSLDLDMPVRKGDRDELAHALTLVPRQQGEGAVCAHRLVSARLVVGPATKPALRVETAHDAGAGQRDVLVEAPLEAGLSAPIAEPASPAGRDAYLFPLEPEGAALVKDKPLTFTMVSDRGSCESTARVE
jgi:DsbC/DsbD-like thiol-disulfide interchange protein